MRSSRSRRKHPLSNNSSLSSNIDPSDLPGYIDEVDLPDFLYNSPDLPLFSQESYMPHANHDRLDPHYSLDYYIREGRRFIGSRRAKVMGMVLLLCIYLWKTDPFVRLGLKNETCWDAEPIKPPKYYDDQTIDWSQYAYGQYATDSEYLCNSLLIFEALQRLNSKASRILLYPSNLLLETPSSNTFEIELLLKARKEYNVELIPVDVIHNNLAYWQGPNWSDSYTKLLIFNQTQYSRVIMLDSDATILQNMDELFFIERSDAVLPRAYWLDKKKKMLSSHIMVVEPGREVFGKVMKEVKRAMKKNAIYDMDIANRVFGKKPKGECVLLPHKPYALLTGEFRKERGGHAGYLGADSGGRGEWSVGNVMKEAKMVHFSDDPLGKPWRANWPEITSMAPRCGGVDGVTSFCEERGVWVELYRDFERRRWVSL